MGMKHDQCEPPETAIPGPLPLEPCGAGPKPSSFSGVVGAGVLAAFPVGPDESLVPGIVAAPTHAINATPAAAARATAIVRFRSFWTAVSRTSAISDCRLNVATLESSSSSLNQALEQAWKSL
jgi:hypothetical protein